MDFSFYMDLLIYLETKTRVLKTNFSSFLADVYSRDTPKNKNKTKNLQKFNRSYDFERLKQKDFFPKNFSVLKI